MIKSDFKSKSSGFTLIELLVTIFIIGLLTSIVTISAFQARVKSRDDKRKADMNSVGLALEMYYPKNRSYPAVNTWTNLASILSSVTTTFPRDPKNPNLEGYGNSYFYQYSSDNGYVVDATLEIYSSNLPSGITGCTSPAINTETQCFRTIDYNFQNKSHTRVSGK